MASRLSVDPDKMMATLKATVFAKASNEEMLALVVVANEFGLNPFLKELYAFPAKGGGIVPIVSYDGWNKMLIRQPGFDGIEFEMTDSEDGKPYSCTATIHIKDRGHGVKVTEYYNECYRNTEPWNNMPRRMLRNRTLCQASRMAFGFAGVKDPDEAADIIDVTEAPPSKPVKLVSEGAVAPATPASDGTSENDKLASIITEAGHSYDDYNKYCIEEGFAPEVKDVPGFAELKLSTVKRSILAKSGLLTGIAAMKMGAA